MLLETVCGLAGSDDLIGRNASHLRQAILDRDTPYLFEHLVRSFSLQGVSDRAAWTYMENRDQPGWQDLHRATARPPACPKLRSYWTYHGCGYRKGNRTCAEPETLSKCSVPRHALRNGRLNQTTYSLFLFIRDVMGGDLVAWIDRSLNEASSGTVKHRTYRMQRALTEPLRNVYGVSDKLLNMTLADILLAAPVSKPLWLETGFSMIAIDTLVHNFLKRTGLTRRLGPEHTYGSACYSENGCADIIGRIARQIDARQFNPDYPRHFPRFVQHAIWRFCAQSELNVCNGNNIDDEFRCRNAYCALFRHCERVSLRGYLEAE
ncbi:hypothetical protein JQ607_22145 [Bradyrhizobium liaoningense]|uniref:hypothetical protein n=1 Tax=Bradyrhizobium liaoningense TaxID=43992 RepID=UPI001BA97958|nr:hypothetical protein [Bradyrhizobium liaoningense]MBR0842912.1 hypothetical protein [Bradyrhizobium liaoningense]